MGICELCYIYQKLMWCNGFPEIYAGLEEGVRSICHGFMCIVLYMNLIWCNGFPEIYGQLGEGVGSVCHGILLYEKLLWCMGLPWVDVHSSICKNLLGVMVSHTSMLDWSREVGSVCHGYMCILLYVKLIGCNGVAEMYA